MNYFWTRNLGNTKLVNYNYSVDSNNPTKILFYNSNRIKARICNDGGYKVYIGYISSAENLKLQGTPLNPNQYIETNFIGDIYAVAETNAGNDTVNIRIWDETV